MITNKNNNDADKTSEYQSTKEGEKLPSNPSQNSLNISASKNEDLFFGSIGISIDRSEKKRGDMDNKMDENDTPTQQRQSLASKKAKQQNADVEMAVEMSNNHANKLTINEADTPSKQQQSVHPNNPTDGVI